MNLRFPARIAAWACLGILLAMAALALREPVVPMAPSPTPSRDLSKPPLQEMLERCQLAGQAAGSDPGCLAAWAENRRRFLGLNAEPLDQLAPDKSSELMGFFDDFEQPEGQ